MVAHEGSWSSLFKTHPFGKSCKQKSIDSPYPKPSPSESYQYSNAEGLKQPHPRSFSPSPWHIPQWSITNSAGLIFGQSGSGSTSFATHPSKTSSRQNIWGSPYPKPSSSKSYQYSNAAGLKQPQPKSSCAPPEHTPQ